MPFLPSQDPLGFSADGDVEKFNRYRAIEVKHGRVAMLAALDAGLDDFDGLPGGSQGSGAWISFNYGHDTRTLSRIRQPSGTFYAIGEWDKYKSKTQVDGWNVGGYLANPDPTQGVRWFDAPAIWSTPQYQVNLSNCDGSTSAYQIQSKSLRDGKVVTDPVNGFADFTGESKPDLVGLKALILPGLIK